MKTYPLPRSFYRRDARVVARALLGRTLVTRIDSLRTAGRIIETEAYLGADDLASHSRGGETLRNRAMFLDGGHAYVYFIYGMYYCFNVVTGIAGAGEAVLIRGVEPIEGIDVMEHRRGRSPRNPLELSNGPGKLTISFGIGPELNGVDLTADPRIEIEEGTPAADSDILATPRIGITRSTEHLWRWVLKR